MSKQFILHAQDVGHLDEVFERLKKFHEDWDGREDDPEDMLIEAPEMAADLVAKMGPIVKNLRAQRA